MFPPTIRTAEPSVGSAARAPSRTISGIRGQDGPVKYPVVRTKSDRVDVEVVGPSGGLDLEPECGGGGCQHLAGEFLYHCHVAHHWRRAWGYGRFYNTLQVGNAHTDTMPDLQELPDRKGRMKTGRLVRIS